LRSASASAGFTGDGVGVAPTGGAGGAGSEASGQFVVVDELGIAELPEELSRYRSRQLDLPSDRRPYERVELFVRALAAVDSQQGQFRSVAEQDPEIAREGVDGCRERKGVGLYRNVVAGRGGRRA
jgi:hypothetical protein